MNAAPPSPEPDHAGVRFPPPLTLAISVATGLMLDRLVPAPICGGLGKWAGWILFAAGLCLFISALLRFKKSGTNVEPWKPATSMIRSGPYRFSRNPIYLSMIMAHTAAALWADSWWLMATMVLMTAVFTKTVIEREESYLERRFGREYLDYKASVRRWL